MAYSARKLQQQQQAAAANSANSGSGMPLGSNSRPGLPENASYRVTPATSNGANGGPLTSNPGAAKPGPSSAAKPGPSSAQKPRTAPWNAQKPQQAAAAAPPWATQNRKKSSSSSSGGLWVRLFVSRQLLFSPPPLRLGFQLEEGQ